MCVYFLIKKLSKTYWENDLSHSLKPLRKSNKTEKGKHDYTHTKYKFVPKCFWEHFIMFVSECIKCDVKCETAVFNTWFLTFHMWH